MPTGAAAAKASAANLEGQRDRPACFSTVGSGAGVGRGGLGKDGATGSSVCGGACATVADPGVRAACVLVLGSEPRRTSPAGVAACCGGDLRSGAGAGAATSAVAQNPNPHPQFAPSSSRRAITCARISAAPSKIFKIRASHSFYRRHYTFRYNIFSTQVNFSLSF